ncbi:hypothetical protein CHS0354_027181 [Potamilus streckersoni]|uniref:Uncharacterized protein n=1 Tax=Potamilus streckersoni TaxID=2493646 RepID=A0AAE0T231_9BIVA|nr:hypothetical protein CHS0354_027181 [Potamilus streckersoni]
MSNYNNSLMGSIFFHIKQKLIPEAETSNFLYEEKCTAKITKVNKEDGRKLGCVVSKRKDTILEKKNFVYTLRNRFEALADLRDEKEQRPLQIHVHAVNRATKGNRAATRSSDDKQLEATLARVVQQAELTRDEEC